MNETELLNSQEEKQKSMIKEKVREVLEQWGQYLPQEYDKDKILFYVKKRNEFLRVDTKIVWALSPTALWMEMRKFILERIKISIQASPYPVLVSSEVPIIKCKTGESIEAFIYLSLQKLFNHQLSDVFKISFRSIANKATQSSLWGMLKYSLESSMRTSFVSFSDFIFWDIYRMAYNEGDFFKYLAEACKAGLGFAVITDEVFYAVPFPVYSLNKDGRLHKDLGPAVVWADGTREYYFNGVRIFKKLAETPAEQLDPRSILTERNAEVRREIVRKIGIERICYMLHAKVVDRKGNYELLLLELNDGRTRPYLKMKNPSIGVYHIEGVPLGIQTVEQALSWRNQCEEEPVALT